MRHVGDGEEEKCPLNPLPCPRRVLDGAEHGAAPLLHGDVPLPRLVSAAPKVPPPAVVALFFI